jgi:two-component system, cell cycle response regulator DivK
MKVLIVEDHSDCRQMLVQMLNAAGLNAIEAMTAEEALAKAASEKPDVIIMDLSLPGMSGIEATTRLKLEPATSHIPVVAFTAWSEGEYKRRAVNAGVTRFLTKPIAFARLMKIISEIPRTDA